ncbi:hypothetical protein [Methylorubrum thiocyanatum]|uniref:hypothetical protein n=1 Tax=Methylorubrum thiocyanatum TaxID=47958 RepID=UPI0035C80E34
MAGKKLARRVNEWGAEPRGRRRARPHVRKAADRDFLKVTVLVLLAIGLLVFLGRLA